MLFCSMLAGTLHSLMAAQLSCCYYNSYSCCFWRSTLQMDTYFVWEKIRKNEVTVFFFFWLQIQNSNIREVYGDGVVFFLFFFFLSTQDRHSENNWQLVKTNMVICDPSMNIQLMNEIRWHRQWKRNGKTTIVG